MKPNLLHTAFSSIRSNRFLLLFAALGLLLTSCSSSRNNWFGSSYRNTRSIAKFYTSDSTGVEIYVQRNAEKNQAEAIDDAGNNKKSELLIFKKLNNRIGEFHAADLSIEKLTESFSSYAITSPLRYRLKGKRLEITVKGLSGPFTIYNNGWTVESFLRYCSSKAFLENKANKNLVIIYNLFEGTDVKQTGTVSLSNNTNKILKQLAMKTAEAMDYYTARKYETGMVALTRTFVDNLTEDLFYLPKPDYTAMR